MDILATISFLTPQVEAQEVLRQNTPMYCQIEALQQQENEYCLERIPITFLTLKPVMQATPVID